MASFGQAQERSTFSGRARPPGATQMRDHTASGAQDQLLSFLESPASYAHSPVEVRVIQTHSSWVFIASPFVFKVKKPMNLAFSISVRWKSVAIFASARLI